MLRITKQELANACTLKLEGKLVGPWVEEFESTWNSFSELEPKPLLDLAGVTYIDPAGIDLLRSLIDRGARISATSNFVSQLLQWEKNS